ncbi:hypothetical protein COU59_01330 [Candidatus Pacearchaeota archaeon CG10_big_fil_rev_8_21_14_0_10_34_12]|nr:MAG: hypothetical protein COU59_01330 [Candidatus Pacearchaeota archaeon CG10_big_fil_rev_8_21_14_0_10_34_12]
MFAEIITLAIIFSIVVLVVFLLIFISLFVFGAPFEPTNSYTLGKMLEIANIRKGDIVADIGSGTGTIVIAFARLKNVSEVHGFEINPLLVWISRRKIKKLSLEGKAFIHRKNFWKQNFSNFDVVTSFQINYVMKKLGDKLKRELKNGSRIVSNTWKFPNMKLKKKKGNVYLYEV